MNKYTAIAYGVNCVTSLLQLLHKMPNDLSDSDAEPTLGELLKTRRSEGQKVKHRWVRGEPNDYTEHSASKKRNRPSRNKSAPRELPSNRPVPVGRDACLGNWGGTENSQKRTVRRFDPRFEEHCGSLRDLHVERNYSFIRDEALARKERLESVVETNEDDRTVEKAQHELTRISQNEIRRNRVLQKRHVLKGVIDQQKDAVRKGKQPFFLKKRELRRLELRAQFEELKQRGGVKKFIEKKRRKLAGKDKKLMATTPQKAGKHGEDNREN